MEPEVSKPSLIHPTIFFHHEPDEPSIRIPVPIILRPLSISLQLCQGSLSGLVLFAVPTKILHTFCKHLTVSYALNVQFKTHYHFSCMFLIISAFSHTGFIAL
jgi:hypothetical protein